MRKHKISLRILREAYTKELEITHEVLEKWYYERRKVCLENGSNQAQIGPETEHERLLGYCIESAR